MRIRVHIAVFVATIALRCSPSALAQDAAVKSPTGDLEQPAPARAELVYDSAAPVGPHHRWRSTRDAKGTETGRYMELATGLNRWDETTGEWKEASVDIEVFEGGAISRHTAYDAIFSPSADDPNGVFDILLPGGPGANGRGRLRGQCVGLAMTDKATGQSVWLAEPRRTAGLVGRDEVIYPESLIGERGFSASIRYKLTSGIAQDVILHTAIPSPEELGFPPNADVVIEVWTHLLDAPPSIVANDSVTAGANGEQKEDVRVDFGAMHFGRGSAFPLDAELPNRVAILANSIPVAKEYVQLNGMQFLIESAPFTRLAPEAAKLRPLAVVRPRINGSRTAFAVRTDSDRHRSFPISWSGVDRSTRVDASGLAMRPITPERQLAMAGYVLDWDLNAGSVTNFTFTSDTTFYIKGVVYGFGTTTIEGGAVVKFKDSTTALMIDSSGSLAMQTDSYRPAFFVARDDDTVGTILGDSTHSVSGYYAYPALGYLPTNSVNLSDIRVRDAKWGVYFYAATGSNAVSHAQIIRSDQAIVVNSSTVSIRNVLVYLAQTMLTAAGGRVSGEHLTVNGALTNLLDYGSSSIAFTNCLFVDVPNFGSLGSSTLSAGFNATNSYPATVFQTGGAGLHYLVDASPYRNCGTTNIYVGLLSEIRKRTTFPPLSIGTSSEWWSTNRIQLFPQVNRDIDQPDLGYHYDPVDYQPGYQALTNANVSVMPGTVIGLSYPLVIGPGSKIVARGTADAPVWFASTCAVQESLGWSPNPSQFVMRNTQASVPDVTFDFVRSSLIHGGGGLTSHIIPEGTNALTLRISNTELFNGYVAGRNPLAGGAEMSLELRNCLLHRCTVEPSTQLGGSFSVLNCTFNQGTLSLASAGSGLTITNTLFDGLTIWNASTSICHNYNGYYGARLPTGGGSGSNDVLLGASMTYKTGPFGRFYQSVTNLINRGSTAATNVGLYHFTSVSPGIKEGNSTVDIGYHYVASDPLGADLIGYWRLDEASGTYAADSSGYGGNGTLVSGPTWGAGKVGSGGLTFDGIDDYVTVPDSSVLRVGANGADFSVAFWLYLRESATGSWRSLMHRVDGEIRTFAMWMRPYDDGIYFRISTTYSPDEGWGGTWNSIPTNQWMHVAYVKEGSNLRLYLNGSQNASAALMGTSVPSNGPLYIGKTPYFAGTACTLDDIRIYNRALTADELAILVSGVTWDGDGDGIPDYREDTNGNGTLDSGETSVNSTTDTGFGLQITQPDARFNLP